MKIVSEGTSGDTKILTDDDRDLVQESHISSVNIEIPSSGRIMATVWTISPKLDINIEELTVVYDIEHMSRLDLLELKARIDAELETGAR